MSLGLRAFLAISSHLSFTSFPPTCCKVVPGPWLTMGFPLCSSVLQPLSLCSLLPGCRLGERLPGAAKAHGKYTSNRHCKACQNLGPGHRIVYSGRLYGHQAASWQWFFCVFAASQKILVLPYFWFILNPLLQVWNVMGSTFPLWAIGMGGAQEAHTECTHAAHPWARSSFCSLTISHVFSCTELKSSHGLRNSLWYCTPPQPPPTSGRCKWVPQSRSLYIWITSFAGENNYF